MRILFITQFFYPDIQATSKIFHELCEDLAAEHDVTVLAGMPLVEPRRKFSNPPDNEIIDGIRVKRVGTTRNVKKTIANRISNHLTYFLGAFLKAIFNRDIDVVIFTSDNPLNVFLALMFPGRPRIYLNQDLYAEQASSTGAIKGLLFGILNYLQNISYNVADKVVVIGESMMKYLIAQKSIPEKKIMVIANWADISKMKKEDRDNTFAREHGLVGKFVIMHSGRLGLTQNLELLLECARDFSDKHDMVFLIIGEGAKKTAVKKMARNMKLDNVRFLHYQPSEILSKVFGTADVAVILYNCCLAHSLVPSRLFSFMACARPVIASIDPACSAARIIRTSECGEVIGIGDLEELKKGILKFYDDPGARKIAGDKGREYVQKYYSRKAMTGKYLNLLKEFSN